MQRIFSKTHRKSSGREISFLSFHLQGENLLREMVLNEQLTAKERVKHVSPFLSFTPPNLLWMKNKSTGKGWLPPTYFLLFHSYIRKGFDHFRGFGRFIKLVCDLNFSEYFGSLPGSSEISLGKWGWVGRGRKGGKWGWGKNMSDPDPVHWGGTGSDTSLLPSAQICASSRGGTSLSRSSRGTSLPFPG